MNADTAMKSNSYHRLIEHRQIDVAAKADRSPTITGTDAKTIAGAFMPLNPAFQQPVRELRQPPLFALTELEREANAARTIVGKNAPRLVGGSFRVESSDVPMTEAYLA
jgi:hypothetical protein